MSPSGERVCVCEISNSRLQTFLIHFAEVIFLADAQIVPFSASEVLLTLFLGLFDMTVVVIGGVFAK